MSTPPHYSDAESVPERAMHEMDVDASMRSHIEPEDNELHAAGQVCARCSTVITAGQDVRRQPDGQFVHEVCPAGDI
jgi:hypothetical protein